jgi:hypothetical protein
MEGIAMQALVRKMQEGHVGATKEVLAITKAAVEPTDQPNPKAPTPLVKKDALDKASQ